MATTSYICPVGLFVQLFSNTGVVLSGGQVYTYEAGTTTPVGTYTDNTLTVLNGNPIILDESGRLPMSCWVASGINVKAVIKDKVGNVLSTIDNLPPIDDPQALLAILANPAAGSGADLVANAVRSYDIFSSMRSAPEPELLSGQTLIVIAEGGDTVNDGKGGPFYWDATSTAADDDNNVIAPTGVTTGRYLRLIGAIAVTASTLTGSANLGVTGLPATIGAYRDLKLSANGTTQATTITAFELILENSSTPAYLTLRNVSQSVSTQISGAGGLDTGSIAFSTWYAVFIIYNPTTSTTSALLSLSATAPTLPSGYTYRCRVGYILTQASTNAYPLAFKQAGRRAQYVVASGTNVAVMPLMGSGTIGTYSTTAPVWSAISVSPFVPPTAVAITISACNSYNSGTTSNLIVAPNNSFLGYATTNPPPAGLSTGSAGMALFSMILESTNIYVATAGPQNSISCYGWEDNL